MARWRMVVAVALSLTLVGMLVAAPGLGKKQLGSATCIAAARGAKRPLKPAKPVAQTQQTPAKHRGQIAGAKTVDGKKLITTVKFDELKKLCADLGYKPVGSTDEQGDPSLLLTFGKLKAGILMYRDNSGIASLTLQAYLNLGKTKADVNIANKWNMDNRYVRFYAKDANYFIESDYDLAGGVTEHGIEIFISNFTAAVTDFVEKNGF